MTGSAPAGTFRSWAMWGVGAIRRFFDGRTGVRSVPEAAPPTEPALDFTRDVGPGPKAPNASTTSQWPFSVALARQQLQTPAQVVEALAVAFGAAELRASIEEVQGRVPPKMQDKLHQALQNFALLADAVGTMPDYERLRGKMGWNGWSSVPGVASNFPTSREAYRQRRYPSRVEQLSAERRRSSVSQLAASLKSALQAPDPVEALEKATTEHLLREIGIPAAETQGWQSTPTAVTKLLDQEGLLPLRAMYQASAGFDHRHVNLNGHDPRALDQQGRRFVVEMTRQVLSGGFEAWRFSQGEEQLACLSPIQLRTYQAPRSLSRRTQSGRTLRSREERGFGLAWATKIGGPSHGFDMLSQCLLPLLGNARNGAIIVDEDGWPGAARSTLRLLPDHQGKPVLYLEMLQVDFEYSNRRASPKELRLLILEHAHLAASELGVPLVLAPAREDLEGLAKALNWSGARQPVRLILEPSRAVFEASDTLLRSHHEPQLERRIVELPDGRSWRQLYDSRPFVVPA